MIIEDVVEADGKVASVDMASVSSSLSVVVELGSVVEVLVSDDSVVFVVSDSVTKLVVVVSVLEVVVVVVAGSVCGVVAVIGS